MIIHQPEIEIIEGEVRVSARVETITDTPLPKKLWFSYPLEYHDAVSDRSEAFFSSLFLLGMHLNETIEVRGEVSPLIARNIYLFSDLYYQKNKNKLRRVNFNFKNIKESNPKLQRPIQLSSFSGGVDSHYTFWSHLFPNISEHPTKLTHGLYIHGFDILLQNNESFNLIINKYKKLFNDWRLPLIVCRTNAYNFYQFRIPWGLLMNPTLAAAAFGIGNQVSDYLQPGSYEPKPFEPINAASYIHLLSTETLNFKSHAIPLDRGEKIERMINWEPVQQNLRVCLDMNNEVGVIACNKCRKCLDTRLILNLLEKQDLFPNYSQKLTSLDFLRFCWTTIFLPTLYKPYYMDMMKSNKRFDFISILLLMTPINWVKMFISTKIVPILPNKIIRFIKMLFYPKQKS
jgi:hypothetical protein